MSDKFTLSLIAYMLLCSELIGGGGSSNNDTKHNTRDNLKQDVD